MSTPPTAPRDAFDAISTSLSQGWQRMTALLFTGPGASVGNWLRWGVIILLAGLSGGTGFNSTGRGFGKDDGAALDQLGLPHLDLARLWPLLVPVAVLAALLFVVFVYVQGRFRFVFLEGIIDGEPRIGGVFQRTGRAGGRYFGFLLLTVLLQVAAVAVPLVVAFPALREAVEEGSFGALFAVLAPMLLIVVPVLIAIGLVRWFVHAFAVPYMWLRDEGVLAATGSAWRAVAARFGSFVLFLVCYFIAAIVAAVAGAVLFCCSCFIWGLPAALLAGVAFASVMITPVLLLFTFPIILALGLVVGWILATITAPIPVFFRSWSLAYLALVDPDVARLAMQGRADAGPAPAPPPAAPPLPPPPPSEPPGPGPTDPGI